MNDKQTAIEALDALLPALLDVADGWPKEKCDKFQEIIITIRAALQSKTVDVDIDDIADTIKNNSPYGKSVIQQTLDHLYANGYLNTPQWQPIETAPKDGIHSDRSTHWAGIWWDTISKAWMTETCYQNEHGFFSWWGGPAYPTRWKPLPPPVKEKS